MILDTSVLSHFPAPLTPTNSRNFTLQYGVTAVDGEQTESVVSSTSTTAHSSSHNMLQSISLTKLMEAEKTESDQQVTREYLKRLELIAPQVTTAQKAFSELATIFLTNTRLFVSMPGGKGSDNLTKDQEGVIAQIKEVIENNKVEFDGLQQAKDLPDNKNLLTDLYTWNKKARKLHALVIGDKEYKYPEKKVKEFWTLVSKVVQTGDLFEAKCKENELPGKLKEDLEGVWGKLNQHLHQVGNQIRKTAELNDVRKTAELNDEQNQFLNQVHANAEQYKGPASTKPHTDLINDLKTCNEQAGALNALAEVGDRVYTYPAEKVEEFWKLLNHVVAMRKPFEMKLKDLIEVYNIGQIDLLTTQDRESIENLANPTCKTKHPKDKDEPYRTNEERKLQWDRQYVQHLNRQNDRKKLIEDLKNLWEMVNLHLNSTGAQILKTSPAKVVIEKVLFFDFSATEEKEKELNALSQELSNIKTRLNLATKIAKGAHTEKSNIMTSSGEARVTLIKAKVQELQGKYDQECACIFKILKQVKTMLIFLEKEKTTEVIENLHLDNNNPYAFLAPLIKTRREALYEKLSNAYQAVSKKFISTAKEIERFYYAEAKEGEFEETIFDNLWYPLKGETYIASPFSNNYKGKRPEEPSTMVLEDDKPEDAQTGRKKTRKELHESRMVLHQYKKVLRLTEEKDPNKCEALFQELNAYLSYSVEARIEEQLTAPIRPEDVYATLTKVRDRLENLQSRITQVFVGDSKINFEKLMQDALALKFAYVRHMRRLEKKIQESTKKLNFSINQWTSYALIKGMSYELFANKVIKPLQAIAKERKKQKRELSELWRQFCSTTNQAYPNLSIQHRGLTKTLLDTVYQSKTQLDKEYNGKKIQDTLDRFINPDFLASLKKLMETRSNNIQGITANIDEALAKSGRMTAAASNPEAARLPNKEFTELQSTYFDLKEEIEQLSGKYKKKLLRLDESIQQKAEILSNKEDNCFAFLGSHFIEQRQITRNNLFTSWTTMENKLALLAKEVDYHGFILNNCNGIVNAFNNLTFGAWYVFSSGPYTTTRPTAQPLAAPLNPELGFIDPNYPVDEEQEGLEGAETGEVQIISGAVNNDRDDEGTKEQEGQEGAGTGEVPIISRARNNDSDDEGIMDLG